MTNKRYEIYKTFQKYVLQQDERPMDEICTVPNGFQLQAQQEFLREYMRTYPNWKSLLLYHVLGSGKSCTAITMAAEYLRVNPKNKVKVVLPARLKTNFIDELISPCAMEAYLSKEDLKTFTASSTSVAVKTKIKAKFTAEINKKYDIMSFERLRINAIKHKKDIIKWADEFTKDSMIIIDEVHNLLSDKYDKDESKKIMSTGVISKSAKGMITILLKILTKNAHPTSKMVFLTATPIFDNVAQLKELVKVMSPDIIDVPSKQWTKISDVIDYLRGKVSYFPGTSINAYPVVVYNTHNIPLSKLQDEITSDIQEAAEDEQNELKESFMAKQRQVSLACLPDNQQVKSNIVDVFDDVDEHCPKVKRLTDVIRKSPGKHVVYSNFVQSGLRVVEYALQKTGWISISNAVKDEQAWVKHKGKVYALWDGSVKDAEKQMIKAIANSKDNIFGDKIRVILGSPSVKEGVSFKHIQHIHLLDPVWNQSAKAQVEGRAIRYCSHVDIDESLHKPLKRTVTVNIYKSVPRPKGLVSQTCDQVIYDIIIEKKKKLVQAGERALKKVAIDHYLFRNMYKTKKQATPKSMSGSVPSPIQLHKRDDVQLAIPKIQKVKNTCPKKRRPDPETNICPMEMHVKKNNQGYDCCYKDKKKAKISKATKPKELKQLKKKTMCPKNRLPIDGKCSEGYILKNNKSGVPCCYKSATTK